jgi:hypothetical protein
MLSFDRGQQPNQRRDVAHECWPRRGRLLQAALAAGPGAAAAGVMRVPAVCVKCITVSKRQRTEMTTLASPRVEMNPARLKHPWPCQNSRPQSPELAAPNSFEPVSSLPSVAIHSHPHSFASPFALAARRDPRSLLPTASTRCRRSLRTTPHAPIIEETSAFCRQSTVLEIAILPFHTDRRSPWSQDPRHTFRRCNTP